MVPASAYLRPTPRAFKMPAGHKRYLQIMLQDLGCIPQVEAEEDQVAICWA